MTEEICHICKDPKCDFECLLWENAPECKGCGITMLIGVLSENGLCHMCETHGKDWKENKK